MEDLIHEIYLLREEIKRLSVKKRELENQLGTQVDFQGKSAIDIPSTLYKAKVTKKQKYKFRDVEVLVQYFFN